MFTAFRGSEVRNLFLTSIITIISIVLLITRSFKSCDINNALDGTEDSMKMIWFETTKKKKKKQKMKKSRLTTSSRQTAQPRMTSS